MKKIKYLIPFLLIPAIYLFTAFKEKPGISELTEKIISMMEFYVDEIPEEKVFLHLDKNLYAAGDVIWFSVYMTAGSPDVPSPLSKVVYVDLLDNEGRLMQQRTVKMEDGHGYGDLRLDIFTQEGLYHIKAYSYWLKGFGEDAVFQTSIQVLDPYNLKFQPSVTFEKKENGNQVNYLAKISAMDNSLKPLSGDSLHYELVNRDKTIQKGIFILDQNGQHELSFELPAASLNQVTALELKQVENDDFAISRRFVLPFPSSSIDVQFLPEGGDLIAGFNNKVAVRAVYPDGSPVRLQGKVVSGSQEVEFSTNESGLAAFNISPQAGQNITAELDTDSGKLNKSVGQVKTKGVNLAVDNSKENLVNILVQANNFTEISPSGEGLLVIHARGRIGHMQMINLQNGVTGARVNKAQLPEGINQVTIFEPEGTPLAERLIFIPVEKEVSLKLQADQVNSQPRGKNKWKLLLEGEAFEGGNYSVSITDANESPYSNQSHIISYLKMESELKGIIHNPKQFFGESRDDQGIDLVMLTHGWRRFNWENLLAGKMENKNFIEQGINVTGTVSPKNGGRRGLSGGVLNVFSKGKEEEFFAVEFGENGKFILDDLDFQDTTLLTISASDKRQKEFVNLELDPPLSKYISWEGFKPKVGNFQISPVMREYLLQAEKRRAAEAAFGEVREVILDEFMLKSEKIDPNEDQITRIYGKGDASLRPEDISGFEGFRDIFQLLQGRFAGVRVLPDPMGMPSITIRGVGSLQAGGPPLILLDNVPVDIGFASSISPRDLASVEVFKDAASLAIFGASGGSGVIALYTKRGAGIGDLGNGVFNLRFPGYSVSREFYMPRYDKESSPAPDFRSTLYWNPKLALNGNSADIEFFNNDVVQKFKVVVQGMDKFGRLSYLEHEINVSNN